MEPSFTEPRLVLFSPDDAAIHSSSSVKQPFSLVGRTIHLPTKTRRERRRDDFLSPHQDTSSDFYGQVVTPPSSDIGPMKLDSLAATSSGNWEIQELRQRLEKIKERRARIKNQRGVGEGMTINTPKLQGEQPSSSEAGHNQQQQQETATICKTYSFQEASPPPVVQDPVVVLNPLPKHEAGAISTCRTFDETIDTKSWTSLPGDVTKHQVGWNLRRLVCSNSKGVEMDHPIRWHQNHPFQQQHKNTSFTRDCDVPGQLSQTDEVQGGRRRLDLDSVICSKPLHGSPSRNKNFSFQVLENDEEFITDNVTETEVPEGILLEENKFPINAAPQFHIGGGDVPIPKSDNYQKEHQRSGVGSLDDVVPRGPAYSEIYSEDSQFHDDIPNPSCLRLANRGPWYLRSDRTGKGSFPGGLYGNNDECNHTMHAVMFVTKSPNS